MQTKSNKVSSTLFNPNSCFTISTLLLSLHNLASETSIKSSMGRAKLKMELIERERSRLQTWKKRKEGLNKKLHELTTLCGVSACMIIHDPVTRSSSIWPSDSDQEVRRLIDGYNSRKEDLCSVKRYAVSDFFRERVKEIKGEVEKLRAKNLKAKYPSWDERLGLMDESQLRGLADALRVKAMNVRSRIQFLKEKPQMPPPPYDSGFGQQLYNLGQGAGFDPMMMMQNNFAAQIPMGMQDYYAAPPPLQQQQQQHYAACYPLLIDESRLDYLYSSMEQQNLNQNHWG